MLQQNFVLTTGVYRKNKSTIGEIFFPVHQLRENPFRQRQKFFFASACENFKKQQQLQHFFSTLVLIAFNTKANNEDCFVRKQRRFHFLSWLVFLFYKTNKFLRLRFPETLFEKVKKRKKFALQFAATKRERNFTGGKSLQTRGKIVADRNHFILGL